MLFSFRKSFFKKTAPKLLSFRVLFQGTTTDWLSFRGQIYFLRRAHPYFFFKGVSLYPRGSYLGCGKKPSYSTNRKRFWTVEHSNCLVLDSSGLSCQCWKPTSGVLTTTTWLWARLSARVRSETCIKRLSPACLGSRRRKKLLSLSRNSKVLDKIQTIFWDRDQWRHHRWCTVVSRVASVKALKTKIATSES